MIPFPRDGRLSFDEFSAWFSAAGNSGNGGNTSEAMTLGAGTEVTLQRGKRLTGLGSLPLDQVVEAFASAADDEGFVSRDAFLDTMRALAASTPVSAGHKAFHRLCRDLFSVLDSDSSGKVDFAVVAASLSVLCGGPTAAKASAAFALYDAEYAQLQASAYSVSMQLTLACPCAAATVSFRARKWRSS